MHLTKEEIKIAVYSLVLGADNQPRRFDIDKLPLATQAFKALNACVNEDEEKTYKDSEIEFNTVIKAFLLESITRQWGVADGIHVLSLKEKLEQ